MPRFRLLLLLALLAACSWLGMMILHESGHVLHAALSGGRVERIVLHPLAFSRTDLSLNPYPFFVAWGGFVWGSALPLAAWAIASRRLWAWPLRFFAGFCLVANGAYLASGALSPVGDTEDMIRHRAPVWIMPFAGLPMIAAGLWCWSGLKPALAAAAERRSVLIGLALMLPALAAAMLAFGLWR